MNSLEMPVSQWKRIERESKTMLDEIDAHRDRFGEVENRLLDAIQRLDRLQLGSPLDRVLQGSGLRPSPAPHVEALDVSLRHALGHSLQDHRDIRRKISEEYESMSLSSELLKEMHKNIFIGDVPGVGQFRPNPSYFPQFDADGNWIASNLTTPSKDVPAYLNRLHHCFRTLMNANVVHPILPIAGYMFEIFWIHPFTDGNGRLARLLLLLLLHKSGYHIGRYISIEGAINVRRLAYLRAIKQAMEGWTEAEHNLVSWCEFIVGIIRDAYQEFSVRTNALDVSTNRLSETAQAIGTMPQRFTTSELETRLPDFPRAIMRITLNRMRRQGMLQMSSSDAEVVWRKVDQNG